MLILHITRDHPPRHCGGLSTAVATLVSVLGNQGIASSVVSFDNWRPRSSAKGSPIQIETIADVQICRIEQPAHLLSAATWGKKQPAQCLVVHHDMLWEFGQEVARSLGVPAVLMVHVLQCEMNRARGVHERTQSLLAQEVALQQADQVVAPSLAVASTLRTHYGIESSRVRVIRLGVPVPIKSWSCPNLPTVTFAGRFDSIKGLPLLLQAVAIVFKQMPSARLNLVGGNPGNAKAERRWKKRFQKDAPMLLQERTTLSGWVSPAGVQDYFLQSRVVVVPSLYETAGLVALEAMALGTPVVASRVGGLQELSVGEYSEWSIPNRDPNAWAQAILCPLKSPEKAREFSKQAKGLATQLGSLETMGVKWAELVAYLTDPTGS